MPKVFAKAALQELRDAQALLDAKGKKTIKRNGVSCFLISALIFSPLMLAGCGKSEKTKAEVVHQIKKIKYSVLNKEEIAGDKILLSIQVAPNIRESDLKELMSEQYHFYKTYYSRVIIWLFASKEQYESHAGLWLAMLSYSHDENSFEIEFDREQLKLRHAIPEEKFGISEENRKEIFWSMADDEARAAIEAVKAYPCLDDKSISWSSDAAAEQLARQNRQRNKLSLQYRDEAPQKYGLTREQLDEINIEGTRKKWPVPSTKKIEELMQESIISIEEANAKIDICKVDGISIDNGKPTVFVSHGKDFQAITQGQNVCGVEILGVYAPKEKDGITLENSEIFYDFRVKIKFLGEEKILKNGDYIGEAPLPMRKTTSALSNSHRSLASNNGVVDLYKKKYEEAISTFDLVTELDKSFQQEKALQGYKDLLIKAKGAYSTTDLSDKNQLRQIIALSERREREISKYLESIAVRGQFNTPEKLSKWLHKNIYYKGERYGDDYWQAPYETLAKKEGDCEDYAFLAQILLQEIGIKSQVISIAYKDGAKRKCHAICIFDRGLGYEFFSGSVLISTGTASIEQLVSKTYQNWVVVYGMDFVSKTRIVIAKNNK